MICVTDTDQYLNVESNTRANKGTNKRPVMLLAVLDFQPLYLTFCTFVAVINKCKSLYNVFQYAGSFSVTGEDQSTRNKHVRKLLAQMRVSISVQ